VPERRGPGEGRMGLSEGNELWATEGGGQVRTWKESDRRRGTYSLETADRGRLA